MTTSEGPRRSSRPLRLGGIQRRAGRPMTTASLKCTTVGCLAIVAALLTGCTPTATEPAPELVEVTRVADGDTLTVAYPSGRTTRVRLLGIDAPEISHDGHESECGADAARKALQDLVLRRGVTLTADPQTDSVDRFGRRLAYVDLDGIDVGRHQIQGGYAEAWYPRSEPRPERHANYLQAQRAAQESRVGAWASCRTLGR